MSTAVAPAISAGPAAPVVTLHSRRTGGQTDRIVVLMEVGGTSRTGRGQAARTRMSGIDKLTYEEMTLEAGRDRRRACGTTKRPSRP